MSNPQDSWSNQQRQMGQQFNRQHPPVLPPPATLEQGGQQFYPLPSLPSLGNGSSHPQHGFTIPSINPVNDLGQNSEQPHPRQTPDIRRPSAVTFGNVANQPLPPSSTLTGLNSEPQIINNEYAQNQLQHQQPPSQHQPSSSQQHQQPQQSQQQGQSQSLPQQQVPPHQSPPQTQQLPPQIPHGTTTTSIGGIPNRSGTSNIYRPLNVKDALSYLDQVKIQFYNQSDVYNNFLDIMKDFKSQSIDTPGVIDRVSTLFKGHPNLIQGFNTFLPPGYKIECSLDPSDPNPIRVTTPTGTTTRPNIAGTTYNQSWGNEESAAVETAANQQQQQQQQQQQIDLSGAQTNGGGQIDFNHAISYVNKIKTRFANQPDIYKQFLEILQTYQREQKPIAEVYEQVTQLFANCPDLLDDFKQFLPDTSNQSYPETQQPQQLQPPLHQQHQQSSQPPQSQIQQSQYMGNGTQLPPVGNFQPIGPSPTQSPYAPQIQPSNQVSSFSPERKYDSVEQSNKKKSLVEENYNQDAQFSSVRSGVSSAKSTKTQGRPPATSATTTITQTAPINATLVPGIPEPIPPPGTAKSSSLIEEISFFDKIKKALGNKQTYSEFLKLLNLFTQDIIDKDTLVERVDSFLGDANADLFDWFKLFVGYEKKPQNLENITFKKHALELSLCKAYGPSYRQLPKAETFMPCSGRDEMCWEVLNDEWVGHPTWASEDSGFIAHRKNQYEEILFKIEEERLEFDYYMESNLRTIQILETIANRIANMTPEQKANFKLPPGLGHNSTTIYKKVIRKIYDKDRGFEVIDALHDNPAIAVPIVLKRLKQKDEEWKRAQREWNKVWREMEQKVFYKSLDHLGLTFKQADKKLLTAKQLVSEISTIKIEQQNKRLHPLTPKPQEQLNYQFDDEDILFDIFKLASVFINKSSTYSTYDRKKLIQFFKFFISLFFGIPNEKFDKALEARGEVEEENEEEEANGRSTPIASGADSSKKRARETDLLKDVLKKVSKSKKDERGESPGPQSSENAAQEADEELQRSSELWVKSTNINSEPETNDIEKRRDKYNFFCNTSIYVFFRHLTTLYDRLNEIKKMNDKVGKEIKNRKYPQFAKDLNLLSHQLEDMGIDINGSEDCYDQVIKLAGRLIEGEIEHQWFEESLRQGYKNKAYKIYTVDKVVQALVKHMHSMITDVKTSEIVVLFENDRTKPISSTKEQILYRVAVRTLMSSDENMFKIAYNDRSHKVNIQYISLDDLTLSDQHTNEEQYNYYVTSYVMSHPTEGVPASKLNMPFSKAFLEQVDEDSVDGRVHSELKVSVCENSYKLFFESGSHEEFFSNVVYKKRNEDNIDTEDKIKSLKDLINGENGWKSTLDTEDETEKEEGDAAKEQTKESQVAKAEEAIKVLFEEGGEAYQKFLKEEEEKKPEEESNGMEIDEKVAENQEDVTANDTTI